MDIDSPYDNESGRSYVRNLAFIVMAILGPIIAYAVNESSAEKATLEARHYQEERAQGALTRIRAFLLNATQLSETLRVLVEQDYNANLDQIETYLDRIVESAPEDLIYGAGVWYEPERFDRIRKYVGPYVHRGLRPGTRVLTQEWESPIYDYHSRDWYKNAVEGLGHPTFTEPYFDKGQVYMTLAMSFKDRKSGDLRGVVTVDMILPQLQQLVDSVNENSADVVSIIGKSGRLLAHPRSQQLIEEARESEKSDLIRSTLDVPAKYYASNQWTTLTSESLMRENGWTVKVSSPKTTIMAGYLSQKTLIIALTIFFEVALLIIYLLIGFFDEGISRLKERSLLALRSERNQIKAIVDNVQFGLFRADRRGRIESGYSASCRDLLSLDSKSELTRRVFWHYFALSPREEENFEAFYEQIFDLPYLATEMVKQIPNQLTVRGKILSYRYYPIMKGEEVESVLIAFADVSRSRLTSLENEENKALLRILRNRERFSALVREILHSDDAVLTPQSWPSISSTAALRKIKRLVHTWKGDLATFGLEEAAEYMHSVEDSLRPKLTLGQSHDFMSVIKSLLVSYLDRHQAILRLSPSAVDKRHITLTETQILAFRDEVLESQSIDEVKSHLQTFVEQSTMERAENILSYLTIAAQDIAKRQDKEVIVSTRGGTVALPHRFEPVLHSLIHIVRNAVDHGLEKTRDREGKPANGQIDIQFSESTDAFTIRISDDGRGIDRSRLKQNVIERGLIKEADWDDLNEEEQLRFVFEESVSTQTTITLLSGRGVGLDRVLSAVEDQGGSIGVRTQVGRGTSFEISLPKEYSAKGFLAKRARDSLVS